MTVERDIDAAAVEWLIRQRDPAFAEWEAFADWMAASPEHSRAYHAAQAVDDAFGELQPAPAAAPVRWSRRAVWMSGALAASLVALIGVSQISRPEDRRYQTAMGEREMIALADGSSIALNGGTTLIVDGRDERRITLERGQALFSVVHRADRPFRVTAGHAHLVNIGTVFDVIRSEDSTSVGVSEGAVAYEPDGANVRIDAGHRLTARDGSSEVQLVAAEPASIGGWQKGRLAFDGAPLSDVAAELERTTGHRIRLSSEVARIPFRGALNASADEAQLAQDLAALTGTEARRDEKGWTLSR